MFNLLRKIICCFFVLISNSYGSVESADPSNFTAVLPRNKPTLDTYNDQLRRWLQTHKIGQDFLASHYKFPIGMDEFKTGNKPLEKYAAFYTAQKAKEAGATDQSSSALAPYLQAAGVDMSLKGAAFANEAGKKLTAVLASAERTRQAEEEAAHQREAAEKEARAKEVLAVQHDALRVRAVKAGVNDSEIEALEKSIEERLEAMRERDALGTALDALRFLTHFVQGIADIDNPLAEITRLNERARSFEDALKTRKVIEKNEVILPIALYIDIPFFKRYESRFNTKELMAVQAWQTLQTCQKLTPDDLKKIKELATLSKKARLEELEKRKIEELKREVKDYLDLIENDLLWKTFVRACPQYFDEIYFWACIRKNHKFNPDLLVKSTGAASSYHIFSTGDALQKFVSSSGSATAFTGAAITFNDLEAVAFQIKAIRQELSPTSTAAENFALFMDLQKMFEELRAKVLAYNRAITTGAFQHIPYLERLTKTSLTHPATFAIEDITLIPNPGLAQLLKGLEKFHFCIKDSDPQVASFIGVSRASGELLKAITAFMDPFKKYTVDFHNKLIGTLGADRGDLSVKILGYKRPEFEEVEVQQPATLRAKLTSIFDQSKEEKEIKKIEGQIEKIKKDLRAQEAAKSTTPDIEVIVPILQAQNIKPFADAKYTKLSARPGEKATAAVLTFFQTLMTNLPNLRKILELGVVDLTHNYDANATLNAKDVIRCIESFAAGSNEIEVTLPLTKEEQVGPMGIKSRVATIESIPFFYYLCDEFLKKLQTEAKKLGANDIHVILTHLGGLKNLLRTNRDDKEMIKTILEREQFSSALKKSATKIKFKPEHLLTVRVKGTLENIDPAKFLGLLPGLMEAYITPPVPVVTTPIVTNASSAAALAVVNPSVPQTPPPPPIIDPSIPLAPPPPAMDSSVPLAPPPPTSHAVVSVSSNPPPPPPPSSTLTTAAAPKAPPPPPGGRILPPKSNAALTTMLSKRVPLSAASTASTATDSSTTLALGTDITVDDLITALDMLATNLTTWAIGPQDQILELERKKEAAKASLAKERQAYLVLTTGEKVDQHAYIFIRGGVSERMLAHFKSITCTEYLNTKDYKDTFIVKFYNEFMQSVEFILWNKIDEFGQAIKAAALSASREEVEAQKAALRTKFEAQTLNALVTQKLITTDRANEMAGKAVPLLIFKLAQTPYHNALGGFEFRTADIFGKIINKFMSDLQAKKAAAMASKSSSTADASPFASALQGLRKSKDTRYEKTKAAIDAKLEGFARSYEEIKSALNGKVGTYITAIKTANTSQQALGEELQTVHLWGNTDASIAEIAHIAGEYKKGAIVANILYDFFNKVVTEYAESDGALRADAAFQKKLAAIDEMQARTNFARDYMDGKGRITNLTVYNILRQSVARDGIVTTKHFQEVYAKLAERGNYSELDFAADIIARFLNEFPAFLEKEVNERLYVDATPIASTHLSAAATAVTAADTAVTKPMQEVERQAQEALIRGLEETATSFSESYQQLDAAPSPDIDAKKMQLVLEFIEKTKIVDARTQDATKRAYQARLAAEKDKPLDQIKGVAGYAEFKDSVLTSFENKLLSDLLARKNTDPRVVELLKLYDKNSQKQALGTLKNLQIGNYSLELLKDLDKLTLGTKTGWLETRIDGLCNQGTKTFDFSSILDALIAMPQPAFLDNFFGTATT